jgi:hypothetical protein
VRSQKRLTTANTAIKLKRSASTDICRVVRSLAAQLWADAVFVSPSAENRSAWARAGGSGSANAGTVAPLDAAPTENHRVNGLRMREDIRPFRQSMWPRHQRHGTRPTPTGTKVVYTGNFAAS